tara:strand:+ start:16 stop:936 length:921 start_codon:yes stop_codon:yes gene_type:complete
MNNPYIKDIIDKVLENPPKLILPEQEDPRIKEAQDILSDIGFVIEDVSQFYDYTGYKEHIKNKKFTNNWTDQMLEEYIKNPLMKSLILLDMGYVDCLVAGANTSTADVIKSSIRVIGLNDYSKWISSSFFLFNPINKKGYTYADCGVIPEPDSEQLVSIAYQASKMHRLISNEEPRIAFLSFSTMGSAQHYKVKRMQEAVKIFGKKYPDILHEGELQFDAAINSIVANKKIDNSTLQGTANVFIFPDLGSGNIAYKITQYLAGYTAWGPLLQGFKKPVHDLSRGCSVDDIVCVSSIAARQSLKNKD